MDEVLAAQEFAALNAAYDVAPVSLPSTIQKGGSIESSAFISPPSSAKCTAGPSLPVILALPSRLGARQRAKRAASSPQGVPSTSPAAAKGSSAPSSSTASRRNRTAAAPSVVSSSPKALAGSVGVTGAAAASPRVAGSAQAAATSGTGAEKPKVQRTEGESPKLETKSSPLVSKMTWTGPSAAAASLSPVSPPSSSKPSKAFPSALSPANKNPLPRVSSPPSTSGSRAADRRPDAALAYVASASAARPNSQQKGQQGREESTSQSRMPPANGAKPPASKAGSAGLPSTALTKDAKYSNLVVKKEASKETKKESGEGASGMVPGKLESESGEKPVLASGVKREPVCSRPACGKEARVGQWYCSDDCVKQAEKDSLARKRARDNAAGLTGGAPPKRRVKEYVPPVVSRAASSAATSPGVARSPSTASPKAGTGAGAGTGTGAPKLSGAEAAGRAYAGSPVSLPPPPAGWGPARSAEVPARQPSVVSNEALMRAKLRDSFAAALSLTRSAVSAVAPSPSVETAPATPGGATSSETPGESFVAPADNQPAAMKQPVRDVAFSAAASQAGPSASEKEVATEARPATAGDTDKVANAAVPANPDSKVETIYDKKVADGSTSAVAVSGGGQATVVGSAGKEGAQRVSTEQKTGEAGNNSAKEEDGKAVPAVGETSKQALELATSIEDELYEVFGGVSKKYRERARTLLFNLKDPSNPELRQRVMQGDITPKILCQMTTEQLASKELSQWREAKVLEHSEQRVLTDADINSWRIVKKTHKGEVVIGHSQNDSGPSIDEPPVVATVAIRTPFHGSTAEAGTTTAASVSPPGVATLPGQSTRSANGPSSLRSALSAAAATTAASLAEDASAEQAKKEDQSQIHSTLLRSCSNDEQKLTADGVDGKEKQANPLTNLFSADQAQLLSSILSSVRSENSSASEHGRVSGGFASASIGAVAGGTGAEAFAPTLPSIMSIDEYMETQGGGEEHIAGPQKTEFLQIDDDEMELDVTPMASPTPLEARGSFPSGPFERVQPPPASFAATDIVISNSVGPTAGVASGIPPHGTSEGVAGVPMMGGAGNIADGLEDTGTGPLWQGQLVLGSGGACHVQMYYQSGERFPVRDCLADIAEVKGRVKESEMRTFLTNLEASQARAVMLVSVVAVPGPSAERTKSFLRELSAQYGPKERLGFAELLSGGELYLLSHGEASQNLLHRHTYRMAPPSVGESAFANAGPPPDEEILLLGAVIRRRSHMPPGSAAAQVPKLTAAASTDGISGVTNAPLGVSTPVSGHGDVRPSSVSAAAVAVAAVTGTKNNLRGPAAEGGRGNDRNAARDRGGSSGSGRASLDERGRPGGRSDDRGRSRDTLPLAPLPRKGTDASAPPGFSGQVFAAQNAAPTSRIADAPSRAARRDPRRPAETPAANPSNGGLSERAPWPATAPSAGEIPLPGPSVLQKLAASALASLASNGGAPLSAAGEPQSHVAPMGFVSNWGAGQVAGGQTVGGHVAEALQGVERHGGQQFQWQQQQGSAVEKEDDDLPEYDFDAVSEAPVIPQVELSFAPLGSDAPQQYVRYQQQQQSGAQSPLPGYASLGQQEAEGQQGLQQQQVFPQELQQQQQPQRRQQEEHLHQQQEQEWPNDPYKWPQQSNQEQLRSPIRQQHFPDVDGFSQRQQQLQPHQRHQQLPHDDGPIRWPSPEPVAGDPRPLRPPSSLPFPSNDRHRPPFPHGPLHPDGPFYNEEFPPPRFTEGGGPKTRANFSSFYDIDNPRGDSMRSSFPPSHMPPRPPGWQQHQHPLQAGLGAGPPGPDINRPSSITAMLEQSFPSVRREHLVAGGLSSSLKPNNEWMPGGEMMHPNDVGGFHPPHSNHMHHPSHQGLRPQSSFDPRGPGGMRPSHPLHGPSHPSAHYSEPRW
eukprot:TRINITY_DN1182_c0_g1_i1.p1 TRINITY_DN1182_c0_g1~~TRINITY_DN1182_c0_g1_i1.p1  ORF type:complete len:2125 (+),score=379.78 TRINITY_DN1182_c0_g1_i1:685-6375(+)